MRSCLGLEYSFFSTQLYGLFFQGRKHLHWQCVGWKKNGILSPILRFAGLVVLYHSVLWYPTFHRPVDKRPESKNFAHLIPYTGSLCASTTCPLFLLSIFLHNFFYPVRGIRNTCNCAVLVDACFNLLCLRVLVCSLLFATISLDQFSDWRL